MGGSISGQMHSMTDQGQTTSCPPKPIYFSYTPSSSNKKRTYWHRDTVLLANWFPFDSRYLAECSSLALLLQAHNKRLRLIRKWGILQTWQAGIRHISVGSVNRKIHKCINRLWSADRISAIWLKRRCGWNPLLRVCVEFCRILRNRLSKIVF